MPRPGAPSRNRWRWTRAQRGVQAAGTVRRHGCSAAAGGGMSRFTALETHDVRFPTSRTLDGSDAVNVDPDYSAAYAILHTDAGDGLAGHGFAFTCGRGTEVQVAAI